MKRGKTLEREPKFVSTAERPVYVDEAKITGSAKYRNDRNRSSVIQEGDLLAPGSEDEGDPES